MSRAVQVAWRDEDSAEALYARFRQERQPARRKRLQALWLVRTGRPLDEASRVAGAGARSLDRWLSWYRRGGLEAVLRRVPGHGARGRACRLTPEQQARVLERCAEGAFRTFGEARAWVEGEWGIPYRYDGMYTLLTRLGVRPKVPRPRAAKADPAAQAAWKKGGSNRRSSRQA